MAQDNKYEIHPIPMGERNMGYWDMFANWFGANANNGTWFIGGIIAACGLWGGFSALVLASVVSYLFLSLIGYEGYQTGLSTTTLSRATFEIRGSIIPSIINLVMFMGWTAVNTFIAATSLSYIFNTFFGWPIFGKPGGTFGLVIGILIMSILHILSVIAGQRSIRVIDRVGIILVIIFVIWEAIAVFKDVSLSQLSHWVVPKKDQMPFGAAIDSLAAFNLAWVTSGADFTRFTNKKKVSTSAPFWGALLGAVSFASIGLCTTISIAITSGVYDPNNSDPSTVANKLGLGIIAMIVIVLTSMTANAVNLQAAGSALTNMNHKITLKHSLLIVTIVAMALTFIPLLSGSFLSAFTAFLDYIGMFLGPIISIMLVDYFLLNDRDYNLSSFGDPKGEFWYSHGVNWFAFGLWVLGVLLYLALKNVSIIKNTIGATFIVMGIIAILYYMIGRISERRGN